MKYAAAGICTLAGVAVLTGDGRPAWVLWIVAWVMFAGAFYVARPGSRT